MGTLEQERAKVEAVAAADAATVDFLELLRQIRDGDCPFDASKKFGELVAAVQTERRAGTFSLKLTVTPSVRGDASKVLIRDDIKIDPPRPETSPSLFYTTDEHGLTRENPRQRSFREVAPAAGFPEQER